MDHAATPAQAGRLAAFVQGVGYLIAATFPYAAGLIRQHVSDLRPAWGVMMAICAILFGRACGLAAAWRGRGLAQLFLASGKPPSR